MEVDSNPQICRPDLVDESMSGLAGRQAEPEPLDKSAPWTASGPTRKDGRRSGRRANRERYARQLVVLIKAMWGQPSSAGRGWSRPVRR